MRVSYLLPLLVFLSTTPSAFGQQQPIRINCGGPAGKSQDGRAWIADTYFQEGQTYLSYAQISDTVDDFLYLSERWQKNESPSMRYNVPVANGQYAVRLLFSENYARSMSVGARIFDVYVEDKMVMTVDIFKEAGAGNKALNKLFLATVTDGTLTMEFKPKVGNPKIGAIEIMPVRASGGVAVHPDIRHVAEVVGASPEGLSWADSYSVGDRCYCDKVTTFDHHIGPVYVQTPVGWKTVMQICQMLGPGPGIQNRPIYNDIQCGNGPPNDAGDEHTCPGRVDIGPEGCGHIGPKWNFKDLVTTGDTGTLRVFVDAGGPTDKANAVSGTTWTYTAPETFTITGNGAIPASVYRSHRSGQTVTYTLGGFVPATMYRVSLGFAEVYTPNCVNGKRVMTIRVNGNLYMNNLDVYKEAGCGGALIKSYVLAANSRGEFVIEIGAVIENGMVASIEITAV